MLGQVSIEEYTELEKAGWHIIRNPSAKEIDKLCDPSFDTKSTEEPSEGEFFVLINYDYDISEVCEMILKTRLQEELYNAAEMEAKRKKQMEEKRKEVADEAFESFDFHNCEDALAKESVIVDFNGWDRGYETSTGDIARFERLVYYSDNENPEGDSLKLTFVVIFKESSADIDDCYINLH
jgi:hypothetical protein